MQARLAQPDARALNVPDPETPADQLVKPYSLHDQLTARLRTGQFHVLECLGLDAPEPPFSVTAAAFRNDRLG